MYPAHDYKAQQRLRRSAPKCSTLVQASIAVRDDMSKKHLFSWHSHGRVGFEGTQPPEIYNTCCAPFLTDAHTLHRSKNSGRNARDAHNATPCAYSACEPTT